MKTKITFALLITGCVASLTAAPLSESTFTEVIKEVQKVAGDTKAAQPAKVHDLVKAPDLVRTGPASRAELTAPDQTLTRVGANTVFSFEPASRNMNLEKGSVLFHSPAGKGGGTIRSGGASAAVLGTTIIVAATPNGGFKFIVLEGKGEARLHNGKSKKLEAGQLVFILPGGNAFSDVLDINLGRLIGGSQLVGGFSHLLPSMALIEAAIQRQNRELANGKKKDTEISPDNFVFGHHVNNGLNAINNNSFETAVRPPLTQNQVDRIFQTEGTPSDEFNSLGGSGLFIIVPHRQSPSF